MWEERDREFIAQKRSIASNVKLPIMESVASKKKRRKYITHRFGKSRHATKKNHLSIIKVCLERKKLRCCEWVRVMVFRIEK